MLPPMFIQGRPNETYGWSAPSAPTTKADIAIGVAAAGNRYAGIAAETRARPTSSPRHGCQEPQRLHRLLNIGSRSADQVPSLYEPHRSAKQIEAGAISRGTQQRRREGYRDNGKLNHRKRESALIVEACHETRRVSGPQSDPRVRMRRLP
jgi:hypothetical protein